MITSWPRVIAFPEADVSAMPAGTVLPPLEAVMKALASPKIVIVLGLLPSDTLNRASLGPLMVPSLLNTRGPGLAPLIPKYHSAICTAAALFGLLLRFCV